MNFKNTAICLVIPAGETLLLLLYHSARGNNEKGRGRETFPPSDPPGGFEAFDYSLVDFWGPGDHTRLRLSCTAMR